MALILRILLLALIPAKALADPVRIAVIDTGFTKSDRMDVSICDSGHWDYTLPDSQNRGWSATNTPADNHGHGTHVAGLIHQAFVSNVLTERALLGNEKPDMGRLPKSAGYCLVILKYYDPQKKMDNLTATVDAVRHATHLKVDLINYSGGGPDFEQREMEAVEAAIGAGITYVAAAGNESRDLAEQKFYPGYYPGVIVVGGWGVYRPSLEGYHLQNHRKLPDYLQRFRTKGGEWLEAVRSSDWGARVDAWELGEGVLSALPGNAAGLMTGTSQATAIHTGKLARRLFDMRNGKHPQVTPKGNR